MIRVLIVDDHPSVRQGVSQLLNHADGITVVGECTDGDQVLGTARDVEPDVVLMDLNLRGTSGLDATRALLRLQPWTRVLMFTASALSGNVEDAARAGAMGYLFKGGDPEALLTALRTVARGRTAWPAGQ